MADKIIDFESAKAQQTAERPGKTVSKCTSCGNPQVPKYRPFCSKRCAQLDLGRWLNESYRVPVVEYDDIDDIEELERLLDEQSSEDSAL